MIRSLLLPMGLFILLAAWSEVPFYLHPDFVHSDEFLLGETSHPLWLADELNHGKALYRDVFTQYGLLSAWSYAWFAAVAGNTPESFLRMEELEGLLAVLLAWILLRRHMKAGPATVFLLIALSPSLLPAAGGITFYLELERLLILVLALAWKPAQSSTWPWIVLVGSIMGAMQLVKFGGGIVAVGAWILTDICLRGVSWRNLARRWGMLLLGYFTATAAWAAALFACLPRPIAWDVLWPSYMMANYASYVHHQHNRLPEWFNFGFFLGVQMGPLLVLGLVMGMILMILVRRKINRTGAGSQEPGAFLFLGLFFLLGCLIYLKHEWLIMAYAWMLVLAAAWTWIRLPLPARLAVTLLFFPGFYAHFGASFWRPPVKKIYYVVDLPTGDRLWVDEKDALRITRVKTVVNDLISHGQNQDAVLGFCLDAGWHHFFGWPAATRNGWFMVGFIRPYDEPILADSLRRTAAVIVVGNQKDKSITSDPRTWPTSTPLGLSDHLCDLFAQRLGKAIVIDDSCWVFPVLPNKSPEGGLPGS